MDIGGSRGLALGADCRDAGHLAHEREDATRGDSHQDGGVSAIPVTNKSLPRTVRFSTMHD